MECPALLCMNRLFWPGTFVGEVWLMNTVLGNAHRRRAAAERATDVCCGEGEACTREARGRWGTQRDPQLQQQMKTHFIGRIDVTGTGC